MGGITQKELASLETEISQIIDNLNQEKTLKQQLLTENETLKEQLTESKQYKSKYQQLLLENAQLKSNQSSQIGLSEKEIAEVLLSAKVTAKQIVQSAKQEAEEFEQIKKSARQAIMAFKSQVDGDLTQWFESIDDLLTEEPSEKESTKSPMIHLYQGSAKVNNQDRQAVVLDAEEVITQYKRIITKYAVKLPEPSIYVKYLEMRFNFTVDVHEHIAVRRILSALRNVFPQFIWTQIIEYGDGDYKLEFIPVSWSYCHSVNANQVLFAAISEMGFGNGRALASIKEQMQAVFQEIFTVSPDKAQNEITLISERTKVEDIKTEATQKRKATGMRAQISKVESKNQEGTTSLIAKLKKKTERQHAETVIRKRHRVRNSVIGLFVVGGLIFMTVTLGQFYAIAQVQGQSMKPTLKNKSIMVIQKAPVKLARNELIAFNVPSMGNEHFVKRIVALPGDSIHASGGDLYVNGRRVKKIYAQQTTADFSLFETSGQKTVPPQKIFVLGDNRQHSTDSRSYGFIDYSQVEGKLLFK